MATEKESKISEWSLLVYSIRCDNMTASSSHLMERLEMAAVFCTSEEPHFPAREMVRQGPLVPRGWHSAPNCEYPQIIGLRFFAGVVHLDRLQIVANDSKVASRVDVHIATPDGPNMAYGNPVAFHSALFRSVGYFTFRNNKESLYRCGELKVISLDEPVLYVKLVLSEPHQHPVNPYAQVGIVSLTSFGNVTRLVLPTSVSPLIAAGGGVSMSDESSLLKFFRGGVERDTTVDQEVQRKIEEMEQAKLNMIAIEDFESARRIKDQLNELIPLGVILHDHEHRKRKAIAEEIYAEAHRLKQIIQRIRAYVGSLKPGMPFQRFDLQAMISASMIPDTAVAPVPGLVEMAGGSPHRSFVKKNQLFDEIPVGAADGSPLSFASGASASAFEEKNFTEEPPLLLSDVCEADRPLAADVRAHLPQGSEALHPEAVSETRASDINGWKKQHDSFGYYLCCCIYSKRFQFREAAFEYLRRALGEGENRGVSQLSATLKKKESEVYVSLLYALSAPQTGIGDTIPSVIFPACDIIQVTFAKVKKIAADQALQKSLIKKIATALMSKIGDSNARVRQVVDATVEALSASTAVGFDALCDAVLDLKPKFARHAEECCKFLTKALVTADPTPACLAPAAVHRRFLKPLVSHANKAVRDAAMHLIAEYIVKQGGMHTPESTQLLANLKPLQIKVVQGLVDSKPAREKNSGAHFETGPEEDEVASQRVAPSPITAERARRTVEETRAANPKLADVFIFKDSKKKNRFASQQSPIVTMNENLPDETAMSITSASPVAKPSVLRQKMFDALETTKTTQGLLSVASPTKSIASSSSAATRSQYDPSPSRAASFREQAPKRRVPPTPVAGRCQFCGEESSDFLDNKDALLEHFFGDCPMLCTCPLCRLPVDIREIHWHLAEDCQHKAALKRCPRCWECVRVEEYDSHVQEAGCIAWTPSQVACPLCHELLLSDDVFWEAHILFPPYCPQNPRTNHSTADDANADPTPDDDEADSSGEDAAERLSRIDGSTEHSTQLSSARTVAGGEGNPSSSSHALHHAGVSSVD